MADRRREAGITGRQVRKHLATAADAFAAWMDARVNPADLEELAKDPRHALRPATG